MKLTDFAYLEEPDILQALAFAAQLVQGREVLLDFITGHLRLQGDTGLSRSFEVSKKLGRPLPGGLLKTSCS